MTAAPDIWYATPNQLVAPYERTIQTTTAAYGIASASGAPTEKTRLDIGTSNISDISFGMYHTLTDRKATVVPSRGPASPKAKVNTMLNTRLSTVCTMVIGMIRLICPVPVTHHPQSENIACMSAFAAASAVIKSPA